jgi:hypothetical protein
MLRSFFPGNRFTVSAVLIAALFSAADQGSAQTNTVQGGLQLDQSSTQVQTFAAADPCVQGTDFCLAPTLNTQDDPVALAQGCTSPSNRRRSLLLPFVLIPSQASRFPVPTYSSTFGPETVLEDIFILIRDGLPASSNRVPVWWAQTRYYTRCLPLPMFPGSATPRCREPCRMALHAFPRRQPSVPNFMA